MKTRTLSTILAVLFCGLLYAQQPVYRITVVSRTTKAINYHHRSGSTMIDFRGTALMPSAKGEAKVESKQGVIKIDANMEKMTPATEFGPEYLTYVMWAITPEGRAVSLGEVLLNGGHHSQLHATSDLQTFGLIITAEPYFAVTQPSDVVVMENFIRKDTTGTIEEVDAKYELLARGQYTLTVNPSDVHPMRLDPKIPLELYEARNAVQIARWTGADKYAADTFQKALDNLQNAEGYLIGKGGKKPIGTVAREACQMAEDARLITIKKMDAERLANERSAAADREAKANSDRERAEADRARAELEKSRADANRLRAEMDTKRAESDRLAAQAAQLAAQQSAEQATANANRVKAEAEAASAAALAQQRAAQADAEKARLAADEANKMRAQAETDRAQLRQQLLQQLNLVLETRDSARGLIVNMSDVLFDTGKFTLLPGAREKLAKVSGILLSHPGLRVDVEGHTDSVGGDDYNQRLSEQRAAAVRAYLTLQSVPAASVTAQGFGKTKPVASNDTPAGRQQNRRVELVVSGEIIGQTIGVPK